MNNNINVVYHFNLAANRTSQDFIEADQPIAALLKAQTGFHYRSIAQCEDGSWLDSVFWEDAASAQAAMHVFNSSTHAEAFMKCIDLDSVKRFEGVIAAYAMNDSVSETA